MAFHKNIRNWKHLAARLLLVPVVAGTSAGFAQGQSFQPSWRGGSSTSSAPAPKTTTTTAPVPVTTTAPSAPKMTSPTATTMEPKDLLKAGRVALSEGKIDAAQDFAMKAEQAAASRNMKWGYFEDTPASLRKDCVEAADKANRAQAADLFKKAKGLYTQKAGSDSERMANLDQALNLANEAARRHGPYSMWEFGEKPGDLIKDIKSAQETTRKKMGVSIASTPAAPTTPSTQAPAKPGLIPPPVMPTTPTTTASAGTAKPEVLKMVAEGRTLLAQDKVLEAKMKGDAARKMAEEKGLLTAFTAGEDTPDSLITACKVKGGEMVKVLMADCDRQIAAGAMDKAEAACNTAMTLSTNLGLYARPVDDRRAMIASKKPATTVAAVPAVPVTLPAGPDLIVPAPAMVKNEFLEKAAGELKRGELDMARSLATKAFNDPKATAANKSEAQAIIRQCEIELASRKRTEAATALNNAMAMHAKNEHAQAYAVMARIDPSLLTPEQKSRMTAAMTDCTAKMNPVTQVGAQDPVKAGMEKLAGEVQSTTTPPVPPITAPGIPSNLVAPVTKPADPMKAEMDVAFDKLKSEAIEAMKKAGELWQKGDTDGCMKTLEEYTAKVNASSQSPSRKAMLLKPIENRTSGYALLKHNYDYELKEAKEKIDNRNKIVGERVAEAVKQDEIKKKVTEIATLQQQGKYKEAEMLALQVRALAPDDGQVSAVYELAKMKRRAEDNKKFKDEDEQFNLDAYNTAERRGPFVDTTNPVHVDPNRAMIAARRGDASGTMYLTAPDRKVDGMLSASYPMLKFENMPLKDVIDQIRKSTGVNITVDTPSLEDEKLSLDSVIISESFKDLSLHSALKIILEKARLVHIIEDGVVKITTERRTKGRMKTKVYHVMDLVTPIPEYKLSDHHTLSGAMAAGSGRNLPPAISGINPNTGRMNGGELVSGANGTGAPGTAGGTLQSNAQPNGVNPMTPTRVQYAEQLKKMITMLVRQGSWSDNASGGAGTIAYYDIGGAMVVNQTADVQREVQDLLDSLRRLQDLSVAVEIRVISLSETYFERIGVDFQANVTTNNASFERSLTTGSFRPEPFVNRIDTNGTTVGWSPATGFSSDLAVPIRPTSYNLTAPPFGGYQNSLSPTLNGGLSLGLAFLNDIQVYMFLEAAAGNRRINIMQAPKITLFNGQTSTVFVGDLAYFATGLQVYSANGQFVYLPVNQAFPIGNGFNPNGTGTGTSNGVSVTVQAIISADRRFVRLNLTPSLTALASATVPLYPITTFITPVFEGGSQGQPIPFTQFFQQPSFTEISAQTTVAIPDGGTVLLGGLKTLAQGRNEFGPPVLSQIPYLNRLFKNVGIGQETRHVMLMVTPRIIINSEEEARQTGSGIEGGLPPQQ